MLGLLAGLLAAVVMLLGYGYALPDAFLAGAIVSLYCYLALGAYAAIRVFIHSVRIIGFSSAIYAHLAGGKIGGFLGFFVGLYHAFLFSLQRLFAPALLIGGSYLLSVAGSHGIGFEMYNQSFLLWGALLLAVGILINLYSAYVTMQQARVMAHLS